MTGKGANREMRLRSSYVGVHLSFQLSVLSFLQTRGEPRVYFPGPAGVGGLNFLHLSNVCSFFMASIVPGCKSFSISEDL